jgi:tRNA threonylcarbamoyladenosine biosynthesis protein TsaE
LSRPGGPPPCLQAEIGVPTAARMRTLGRWLAPILRPGDLVVLNGPLGAGKTTLVQGIGDGLHVRGPVTSPTFVIARVHPPRGSGPALVHVDAYRLSSPAEVDDLDLDADLERSVTVVEWGGGLVEELAPSWLDVTIVMPGPGLAAGQVPAGEARLAGDLDPDGEPGPGGVPGEGDAPEEGDEPGEDDEPRTVLLTGRGERWAAAAESVRGALIDVATGGSPGTRHGDQAR